MKDGLYGDFQGTFPFQPRYASVGRVRLHYVDEGPPDSPPLLFVHGNPTWSYLWRDVLAAGTDPANPWRVIAVDQLDMGFSERTGLFRRLDDRVRGSGGWPCG